MNWKEILASYPENEDMIFLYEEWGETPYLRELFTLLSEYQPDWNKEKELGSWAAGIYAGSFGGNGSRTRGDGSRGADWSSLKR